MVVLILGEGKDPCFSTLCKSLIVELFCSWGLLAEFGNYFFFVLNSGHENNLWSQGTALIWLVFCRQCVWKGVRDKLRRPLDWQTIDIFMLWAEVAFSHMWTPRIVHTQWNTDICELKHFILKPVPHTCLWPFAMSFQHIHAMFLFPLYLPC